MSKFFVSESREGFCVKSAPTDRYPKGVFVEGFFSTRGEADDACTALEEANRG